MYDITTIIYAIHQTVQSENGFEQGHLRIQTEPVMCIKLILFLSSTGLSYCIWEVSACHPRSFYVAWWKRMKTGRLKNNPELKHSIQGMAGSLQNMRSSVMTVWTMEAYGHVQKPTTMKTTLNINFFVKEDMVCLGVNGMPVYTPCYKKYNL